MVTVGIGAAGTVRPISVNETEFELDVAFDVVFGVEIGNDWIISTSCCFMPIEHISTVEVPPRVRPPILQACGVGNASHEGKGDGIALKIPELR